MEQPNAIPEFDNYAARAKELLNKAVRAGALVIVPIGLAVSAQASMILPTTATCTLGSNSTGCSVSGTQLPDQNGVDGVSVHNYEDGYLAPSSGGTQNASINFSIAGPLAIDGGGTNCAGVGGPCDITSLLFSWQTYVDGFQSGSTSPKASSLSNFYTFAIGVDGATLLTGSGSTSAILGGAGPSESLTGSASVAIPTELQAKITDLIAGSPGGNVHLTLSINVGFTTNNPGSAYIDFFQPNFSVTAEAPPPVPEPATTGLALAGLAGVWARFRRKRA